MLASEFFRHDPVADGKEENRINSGVINMNSLGVCVCVHIHDKEIGICLYLCFYVISKTSSIAFWYDNMFHAPIVFISCPDLDLAIFFKEP